MVLDDMPECKGVETWISLPRDPRPAWWDKCEDPVCRLRVNLYGHPLAGLLWGQHSHKAILAEGFEPVRSWECLYVHRSLKLFLSVSVDDFKMAGKADNLIPMWERLGKRLDLWI